MCSSGSSSLVIEVLKSEDSKRRNNSYNLKRRVSHFLDKQDCKENTVFRGDQIIQVTSRSSSNSFFHLLLVFSLLLLLLYIVIILLLLYVQLLLVLLLLLHLLSPGVQQ